jgi:diguanylate cyclase (GGDEF)-like protein
VNPLSKIRVLLLEDDEDYARLLKKVVALVETNRYEVDWVETLEAAARRLEVNRYDLILTDLCLPDSQGLNTFREVQAQCEHKPIVILTNIDDENTALAAVREGAQDYIYKAQLNVTTLRRSITYAMERQREQVRHESLIMMDELTGLYNRRGFMDFGEKLQKLSNRMGEPLALFYADLDRLRNINSRYGHPEGDHVLQEVAAVLRNVFRDYDILARIGGDEFAVLSSGIVNTEAQELAARFENELSDYQAQTERYYTISTVFVCSGGSKRPINELMELAESAMHAKKLLNN